MDIPVPCVVKDYNAKTAIVYKVGRKFIYLIPMKSGKLTVTKLTAFKYVQNNYVVLDTPMESALFLFLRHSGGHTETAKQALLSIISRVIM